MSELGADPYGQTLRSVRRLSAEEDRSASPKDAPHSYGQTFRSVRQHFEGERHLAPPNDRPLLPKGLTQPRRTSPRMQSFDYTGPYAYSITINTDQNRPYFRDDRFVRFCIRTLETEAAGRDFDILAYCFMPTHAHILTLGLDESSRLKPFIKQFKQITGFVFKQEHGAPLWHRSYHDRVLRKDEHLPTVAAYIWGNPVRAGLVDTAEEYSYSGPAERLLGEVGRLGEEAALGGQTLRAVRTGLHPPSPTG